MRGIKNNIEEIADAVLYKRGKTGMLSSQEAELYSRAQTEQRGYACKLPMQVHEILIAHQLIENPVYTHTGEESLAVSKADWVYRMEFEAAPEMTKYLLRCNGLDTIVDIYLNEVRIGSHKDMFYPFETEIHPYTDRLNVLLFHFYSPVQYLEQMKEQHRDDAFIDPAHYIRKAPHDFEDFLGIKPYFASIGIFEPVIIESRQHGYIADFSVAYRLDEKLESAAAELEISGEIFRKGCYRIRVTIADASGSIVYSKTEQLSGERTFTVHMQTDMIKVELWWPSGYGRQPLYDCRVYLEQEKVIAAAGKQIGFRRITWKGPFDLQVNGMSVKLWGANLVPLNGLTHCFDSKRAERILFLAKQANMNMIRLWGGGEPYPDELYGMADRMGLLVWGEFFHKWGMYPEDDEYLKLYRKEAEYMLMSFRHHPSLVMWCGGNESQMGAALDYPGQPYIGTKIFQQYEKLCTGLDPDRYFHVNSPMEGTFVNDPRKGDFHGWNHLWYVPYDRYPVMFSENSRVSPPVLRSLKKYIPNPEELWPPGFASRHINFNNDLLPPAWMKLKTGPEPYWCSPVEQFYDATTPEELIYQCQAAHGKLMKTIGERLRRGRPAGQTGGERRCKGQLIWKLNDSWPQIFCSLLDYDLQGGIPYYTIKRVYQPLHVSFDIEEHITIWAVNDSGKSFSGTLEFVLFHPISNEIVHQFNRAVVVACGEALEVCDLDHLTQFKRENLLYACLKDNEGTVLARNYEFVEIERNFSFPDAAVTIEKEGEDLIITTDRFARCIALEGTGNNEETIDFDDNYFDLLPFEKRRIKVYGSVKPHYITAKPFYSSKGAVIKFQQEEQE